MLLVVRRARDARNDAEDGAQSVVHAVNRVGDPTAAAPVPALAFQDGVENTARSGGGRRHRVQDAGVRFFLEGGFAQKLLRVGIVGESAFALGAITRFVAILRRFHPANGDVEPGHPVPPAIEFLA